MDILIIIDMQNDFIDGSLGTKEAQEICPKVLELIENRKENTVVFATRDTHKADYLTTREGRMLPVEHCIEHTTGWEIRSEIEKALADAGAEIIDKGTFGSEKLVEAVKEITASLKQEEITMTLAGLCTDICVVSNALLLKAAFPEAEMIVRADCCAGVTKESHEAAILTMKMCQIRMEE